MSVNTMHAAILLLLLLSSCSAVACSELVLRNFFSTLDRVPSLPMASRQVLHSHIWQEQFCILINKFWLWLGGVLLVAASVLPCLEHARDTIEVVCAGSVQYAEQSAAIQRVRCHRDRESYAAVPPSFYRLRTR